MPAWIGAWFFSVFPFFHMDKKFRPARMQSGIFQIFTGPGPEDHCWQTVNAATLQGGNTAVNPVSEQVTGSAAGTTDCGCAKVL